MHKVQTNYSSCTSRSSENICSRSGGAQEKGKTGWNSVYHKNWWFSEFRRYVVGADALTTIPYLVYPMPQGQAKKEMKLTLTWHKLCCSLNEYTRLVTFFNSYIYIYIYIYIYLLSARHHHMPQSFCSF